MFLSFNCIGVIDKNTKKEKYRTTQQYSHHKNHKTLINLLSILKNLMSNILATRYQFMSCHIPQCKNIELMLIVYIIMPSIHLMDKLLLFIIFAQVRHHY